MVDNLPDSIKVGTITVAVGGASIDLFDKRTYKAYLKEAARLDEELRIAV